MRQSREKGKVWCIVHKNCDHQIEWVERKNLTFEQAQAAQCVNADQSGYYMALTKQVKRIIG